MLEGWARTLSIFTRKGNQPPDLSAKNRSLPNSPLIVRPEGLGVAAVDVRTVRNAPG